MRRGAQRLALPTDDAFETPFGSVEIDHDACARLRSLPQVVESDAAHAEEHSLEVHLPFLQATLGHFALIPLVVGEASPQAVAEVLETLWGGPETLIVVSSDLSHYHDYETAKQMDAKTSKSIEELDFKSINSQQACGVMPLRGLMFAAKKHALHATAVDCRNSGDTAGPRDQVVGYGSYVFE